MAFDDCSMTVLCTNAECGDSYDVESDAFSDGCVKYHFRLVIDRASNKEEA